MYTFKKGLNISWSFYFGGKCPGKAVNEMIIGKFFASIQEKKNNLPTAKVYKSVFEDKKNHGLSYNSSMIVAVAEIFIATEVVIVAQACSAFTCTLLAESAVRRVFICPAKYCREQKNSTAR